MTNGTDRNATEHDASSWIDVPEAGRYAGNLSDKTSCRA
jgi:hypothetical protein